MNRKITNIRIVAPEECTLEFIINALSLGLEQLEMAGKLGLTPEYIRSNVKDEHIIELKIVRDGKDD